MFAEEKISCCLDEKKKRLNVAQLSGGKNSFGITLHRFSVFPQVSVAREKFRPKRCDSFSPLFAAVFNLPLN